MDREAWNQRYRQKDFVWSVEPNRFLVPEVEGLTPGRALDLAAGEGRNAIWLVARGWAVTAVDWSQVGLEKGRRLAEHQAVEVDWVLADLGEWEPPARAFALVIVLYLQPPAELRGLVWRKAAGAVGEGGRLIVIGHDVANLTEGWGGPPDPVFLYTSGDVVEAVGAELEVVRAEKVLRPAETDEGLRHAVDNIVVAVRR
ncbi:MAG: class I SAM-dependent methyltransferase [Actinomycetota bacterium]